MPAFPKGFRTRTVTFTTAFASSRARSSASMSTFVTKVKQVTGALPVPEDAKSKAHHVLGRHGERLRFLNPWPSAGPQLVPWYRTLAMAFHTYLRYGLPSLEDARIPVAPPAFSPARTTEPVTAPLRATWLGHACYHVEFPGGLRVLFDPVFEQRCMPTQWIGPRRCSPPGAAVADLPFVDAVVISHSHFDHLSDPTVRELHRRHPAAHFFVGLGLARWFRELGVPDAQVSEMDWWEDAELTVSATAGEQDDGASAAAPPPPPPPPPPITAQISCLPSQHASGRSAWDKDVTLWASWSVRSGGKAVWFAGDTGYRAVPRTEPAAAGERAEDYYGAAYADLPRCPAFAHIGALRGPFDLGLIPIGAYQPRHVWSNVHVDPLDAVELFGDTRCRRAMGVHWGTWALTSEDVDEPPAKLREALKRKGLPEEGLFDVCAVGETREF
ncbi:hypothetical protein P8C59_000425 [Phyllachora maydis]|uniref:Metallo-beta-lactamase domain-containing protein n=1 Tax=Phyllachora maydis TaxID=1825666 RepID=A0AAD9HW06_9PEZI|nr:hypothetical protein P8C59_000425 [Phyllachora maydis]